MQIEKLRRALGIVARHRVRRDIIDLFVAHPDDSSVIEGLEILLAGAQHVDLRTNGQ